MPDANQRRLLTQAKNNVNGRTDLHGLFIEHRRLVNPLLHSVEGRLAQQRMSADHAELLNVTVFADNGGEFHGARNARALGDLRVDGLRLTNQLSVLHAAANGNDAGTWRRRWLL